MIRVENIGKHFEGQWIFRGVALEVRDQDSVVLIGPSGGGKSVLLKIISGLLEPDEGRVILGSSDIGMLFQRNALFDSMTVEENLLFPLRERRGITGSDARKRAAHLLEAVGLKGNDNLFPVEISGGMQKRLGIARTLIVEPRILLYDEPTAGLDPVTSRVIADLILELRRESRTTLLTVTNDIQRAYQLADRIVFLAQGELRDGGTPLNVQETRDPELRQFIYGLSHGPLTSSSSNSDVTRADP